MSPMMTWWQCICILLSLPHAQLFIMPNRYKFVLLLRTVRPSWISSWRRLLWTTNALRYWNLSTCVSATICRLLQKTSIAWIKLLYCHLVNGTSLKNSWKRYYVIFSWEWIQPSTLSTVTTLSIVKIWLTIWLSIHEKSRVVDIGCKVNLALSTKCMRLLRWK